MKSKITLIALTALASAGAQAADWSDTSIGVRYGTEFREPYNQNDIKKVIVNLTHADGYKYGGNYFNVDLLQSSGADPAAGSASGAQEAYIVYRHTLDFSKISGTKMAMGPIRSFGMTAGFDWNTKNDGYSSKKRMLVIGPTMMMDVPGFLDISLLLLKESNAPTGISRYSYKTHAALSAAWSIGISDLPLAFEGFALYIASKGKDEFGGQTKPETNIDMQLMWDVGVSMGGPKGKFKLGVEYQYWKNKFGNDHTLPFDSGAFAKTPMIRAEYHF